MPLPANKPPVSIRQSIRKLILLAYHATFAACSGCTSIHWKGLMNISMRLLTRLEEALLRKCEIFRSLADMQPITLLGSSLVELKIEEIHTTSGVLVSCDLLAALQHLRRFIACGLEVEDDNTTVTFSATIPFFEANNNGMVHFCTVYSPGNLHWIPPAARFNNLTVGTFCVHQNPELVNRWINSSAEGLKYLGICGDIGGTCH